MSRKNANSRTEKQRSTEQRPSAAAEAARVQGAEFSRATSAVAKATGELQDSVVRRTDRLQREAMHQLRMATNPAELMTVQTALLMAGWQHSIQCTTDLANVWFALGSAGAVPQARKTPLN